MKVNWRWNKLSQGRFSVLIFFLFEQLLTHWSIFTGRNEVLAKVIFSQASVILFTGGVLQIFGGFSKFSGDLQIFGGFSKFSGVSKFLGGLQIFGGISKFSGGPQILGGLQISGGLQILGGLHRNTVNVRPVRILLECILVPLNLT